MLKRGVPKKAQDFKNVSLKTYLAVDVNSNGFMQHINLTFGLGIIHK